VLKRVQNVGKPRSPHEYGFGDDEGQPKRSVPETKKAYDSNADGGKSQLHLKAAIDHSTDSRSDLVCIDDMAEESTHDVEPSGKPDCVDGYDLNGRFFANFVARAEQVDSD